jgi:hypothetical protein
VLTGPSWISALSSRYLPQLAPPAAPVDAVEAADAFWALALEHAGEQARAGYADSQQQLADAEATAEATIIEAIAARDQAMQAADNVRRSAETRSADLERLLVSQTDQIEDMHRQRDGLMGVEPTKGQNSIIGSR